MYEIMNWCFLCASERDVNVDIGSLDEPLRDSIGIFSIINFSLVSSRVCDDCDGFLKKFCRRKKLYGRVELMYMEILRMRNKPSIDVRAIRAKHDIVNEVTATVKTQLKRSHSLVNAVEFEINEMEDDQEIEVIEQVEPPKLLNPTLVQLPEVKAMQQIYVCDLCNYSCSSKALVKMHISTVHKRTNRNSFKCAICSKIFRIKNAMQSHLKTHEENRPKFSCLECNKSLLSQSALSVHMQTVHKQKKGFQCSTCPKLCVTKGALKKHERTHLNVKSLAHHVDTHGTTEYPCPECGKYLNTKRTLTMHLLTHSTVMKFTCQFCKSQFKRAKDYKEHLMAVHTNLKPYSCDWCTRKFSNGPNCRKHKRETHPTELEEAEKNQKIEKVKLPTINELIEMIASKKNAATQK